MEMDVHIYLPTVYFWASEDAVAAQTNLLESSVTCWGAVLDSDQGRNSKPCHKHPEYCQAFQF